MDRGVFLTIEGCEGVGKSTQIATICSVLQQLGISFIQTREPGGTELGEAIRSVVLQPRAESVDSMAELLLIFAARRQHWARRIHPALMSGQWVVCDRFTDATFAYQGGGRQLSEALIASVNQVAMDGIMPDLTLLLDAPVSVGMSRASRRGALDRFEREEEAFFTRVRDCYLERAAGEPERFMLVDAALSLDVVTTDVAKKITAAVERWRA